MSMIEVIKPGSQATVTVTEYSRGDSLQAKTTYISNVWSVDVSLGGDVCYVLLVAGEGRKSFRIGTSKRNIDEYVVTSIECTETIGGAT